MVNFWLSGKVSGKEFKDVQVATDSILAVQAVTTNQEDISYVGICAEEISSLLKIHVVLDIIHACRSANKVTHHIANFVSSFPSSFVWVNGEFSFLLIRLVMDDLI